MTLLIYSLISGTVLTALWLTYRLSGMIRLTHFRLNRVILIGMLIVSFLMPLLAFRSVETEPEIMIEAIEFAGDLPEVAAPVVDNVAPKSTFDLLSWLPTAYLTGLIICAIWSLLGLVGVIRAVARGEKRNGLIIHKGNIAPFTWGRWIILSEKDAENSAILLHEQAHLRANHWLDILLSRVANCILWYWPTAWLYTRDLRAVHEFEADNAVLASGVSPNEYQLMLIKVGAGRPHLDIVNPFNYYSLKKRIIMMKKQSSSAGSRMRALVMLPSLAALILLGSAPALATKVQSYLPEDKTDTTPIVIVDNDIAEQDTSNPLITVDGKPVDAKIDQSVFQSGTAVQEVCKVLNLKPDDIYAFQVIKDSSATARYGEAGKNGVINIVTKQNAEPAENETYFDDSQKVEKRTRVKVAPEDEVFTEVEVSPKFPGGDNEMYHWISKNLRYPENAEKNNVQGRVIVSFVIEKDGSVGEAKIVRGVDPELDAEAIRVIKSLPDFIPGTMNGKPVRVWYTLPLMFKLAPKKETATNNEEVKDLDPTKVVAAQFPGGEEAMFDFVVRNIRYPEADAIAGKSGVVQVNILVDTDGSISEIKIADNSGSEAMAAEAIRVVKRMPEFTPATYEGKPVSQWKTIPFTFKIY